MCEICTKKMISFIIYSVDLLEDLVIEYITETVKLYWA